MIELFLRFVLLIGIFLGFYQLANKFRVKEEFIPIVTCSFIGLIVFVAGMMNILTLVVYILIGVSVFSLIKAILDKDICKRQL
jgi:hypothetical protein